LIALVSAGCADGATAREATIPQLTGARALADVQGDDNDDQGDAAGKPGSITIVLDVVPNGPTDVQFTTTGKKFSGFTLDDDADPTLPNSRTVKLKPGSYTVQTATGAGPYVLTGIICAVGGGGTSTTSPNVPLAVVGINLVAGDVVTCTFLMNIPTPPI
jgi:hypothetical protein